MSEHPFFEAVARAFPVCAASDEFYFFPQAVAEDVDWSRWDDFSDRQTREFAQRLLGWESQVREQDATLAGGDEACLDNLLLLHSLKTLREQLGEMGSHRSQPSFHLSVACVGLEQAMESGDAEAWGARIRGLPLFLDRAAECLESVPAVFREAGEEMVRSCGTWISSLAAEGFDVGEVPDALGRFGAALRSLPSRSSFRLSEGDLDLLLRDHFGCGTGAGGIREIISMEIEDMEEVLKGEAARLTPGSSWQTASSRIPAAEVPEGGVLVLYHTEALDLAHHCCQSGIIPPSVSAPGTLQVLPVPRSLEAVRASDAYTARPGHPARGGSFFVFAGARGYSGRRERSLEYRMTTAHETWPGHHLLDLCRWNLERAVRRHVERPLFYEGWACLGEELMARTGYFDGPWDRFILARRRLRRAVRGNVDLGLQSGSMSIAEAEAALREVGFPEGEARIAVRKYALRPGYQVCYTVGLSHFLSLLEAHGKEDIPTFARDVLSLGEIGFEELGRTLRQGSTA